MKGMKLYRLDGLYQLRIYKGKSLYKFVFRDKAQIKQILAVFA